MMAVGSGEMSRERWWVRPAWYIALIAATLAYLAYNFRLHHADFSAPLCPAHNDSAALLAMVTAIQESGWPWRVERVGAPGISERYDYPLPEHAHYLLLRLLVGITHSPFTAFNLWCLLSYPVTAACAFAVMRALGVSRPIGFALAMVYTFLPYHAGRVFTHTMLAYYHTVPLIVLPIAWILIGQLPYFGALRDDGRRRLALWNGTTFWTLLLSAIVAASSPYYAFFGCYFLLVAGLYRGLSEGSWRPVASGSATAFVVAAMGFACAIPFVLAQREHGPNPAVAQRHANEADVYSLKLTKLVLPSGAHRVGAIGHVTRLYNTESLNDNENRDGVLGLIGVAGFAILIGRLLMARAGPTLLGGLAVLNVAALVLGASGGLGGLFNFLVYPQIRCYNRVCVFIAFWCLLAIGLLVDRWAVRGRRRLWLVATALLVFGLWDLTSQRQSPHHSELQANHAAWGGFVRRMEDALPPGAMVFQLPAASYPEVGTLHRMPDYAHLACYSYSSTLRWSYGTCRNRRWDEWQQHVTRLTPSQMIRALCLAGFDGLYVDRRGFADGAQGLLPELRSLLGTEIVASDSGEQLLFSLTGFARQLRLTMDQTSWVCEQSRLLNRPCVLCQNGFLRWAPISPPEPRRATHSATMRLINPGEAPRRVTLTIMWQRHTGREIDVRIVGESLGVERDERPSMDRGPLVIDMDLPPGEHLLNFNATPKPIGLSRMYTAWNATEVRLDTKD